MEPAVLRFRCYRCDKLLGVSPNRAGRVVACPSCKAELIVPEPEPESEETTAITIEPRQPTVPSNETAETSPSQESEPPAPDLAMSALASIPGPDTGQNPIAGLPGTEPSWTPIEGLPPIALGAPEPILPRESRPRGRDVILPAGVVLAWSLLVILAVLAAFGLGVMVGHYVWKVR